MRLMLADDHLLVRDALKVLIERGSPDAVVLTAESLPEAVQILGEQGPVDLAILDLNMPGMNGTKGIQQMMDSFPEIPVAIISGSAERDDVIRSMEAGAVGYFPKTLAGRALVGAIQLVLSGEKFVPASFGLATDAQTGTNGHGAAAGAPESEIALTKRERDVLHHLCKGAPNKVIARELDLQEVTVKLHIRGICRKLGAMNRTQAVLKALELGIAA